MRSALIPPALVLLIIAACAPMPSGPISADHSVAASPSLVAEGTKAFEQMKAKSKISYDPAKNAAVRRVANRLKPVIPLRNADWEFVVFENDEPNAFALPGGKVGVNTGLFQITRNDAGLATVLGHEIAHVSLNHAGQRRQQGTAVALGGLILDGVLSSQGAATGTRDMVGGLYGAGANVGVMLPHSRTAELEADKLGTLYMARAGYNPNEAIGLWQRFGQWRKARGSSQGAEFLRTHPLDETRIQALRAFMPEAVREYRPR